MKQLAAAFLIILIGWAIIQLVKTRPATKSATKALSVSASPSPVATPVLGKKTTWLFVPYWAVGNKPIDSAEYNNVVYFGILPTVSGIDTTEQGYKNLSSFTRYIPSSTKTYLAIRLVESELNTKLIADPSLQQVIATQAAKLAKANGFSGVVLDFEYNALSFDSVIKKITDMYDRFATVFHAQNVTLYVTVYGDAVYRARPYNLSAIAKNTDGILIMTYDFHKAGGDPGPDFPLSGKETYGYDMHMLATDFLKAVPREKLTFIFGMFGYDWPVDEKGRPAKQAASLALVDAQKQFQTPCVLRNCLISREKESTEMHAMYTDSENQKHEVWFEDMNSVKAKEHFLQTSGINSFGFWAYSYF